LTNSFADKNIEWFAFYDSTSVMAHIYITTEDISSWSTNGSQGIYLTFDTAVNSSVTLTYYTVTASTTVQKGAITYSSSYATGSYSRNFAYGYVFGNLPSTSSSSSIIKGRVSNSVTPTPLPTPTPTPSIDYTAWAMEVIQTIDYWKNSSIYDLFWDVIKENYYLQWYTWSKDESMTDCYTVESDVAITTYYAYNCNFYVTKGINFYTVSIENTDNSDCKYYKSVYEKGTGVTAFSSVVFDTMYYPIDTTIEFTHDPQVVNTNFYSDISYSTIGIYETCTLQSAIDRMIYSGDEDCSHAYVPQSVVENILTQVSINDNVDIHNYIVIQSSPYVYVYWLPKDIDSIVKTSNGIMWGKDGTTFSQYDYDLPYVKITYTYSTTSIGTQYTYSTYQMSSYRECNSSFSGQYFYGSAWISEEYGTVDYGNSRLCHGSNYYFFTSISSYGKSLAYDVSSNTDLISVDMGTVYNPVYDDPSNSDPDPNDDDPDLDDKESWWEKLLDILDGLGDILDSILNIPAKILSVLKDLITWLFVPSDGFMDGYFDSMMDNFENNTGLLTYPLTAIINFLTRILNIETSSAALTLPDIEFMGYSLVSSQTFSFDEFLDDNESLNTFYGYYLVVVRGILIFAVIRLAYEKFEEMTKG
jgi:hypothetical protein